jgi:mono/diheme cytochrome c family protein
VGHWPVEDIAQLLRTGSAPHGQASGPMAEVVFHGTQYLSDDDVQAMAVYLKSLSPAAPASSPPTAPATRTRLASLGEKLYGQHCASCHGEQGQGVAGAYPALAGNRAVTMPQTQNLLQIMLHGGFGPATAGRPRPYGMPPFMLTLDDTEIAAVLTHIRGAWGHQAREVTPLEVLQMRQASSALRP